MKRHLFMVCAVMVALGLAQGQVLAQSSDDARSSAFDFAGDRFVSGTSATTPAPIANDLFAAGERAAASAEVSGNAHMAGRRIAVTAPVGGSLYAAGMDIEVGAPIGGSALTMGYDITIAAPVAGNLRATGKSIKVNADVGGGLLAMGQSVALNAAVAGDVDIAGETVTFGEAAAIGGTLTLRGKAEGSVALPEGIAGEVIWLPKAAPTSVGRPEAPKISVPGVGQVAVSAIRGFVTGVLVVAALALLAASLAPIRVEDAVERTYATPGAAIWAGAVTLALVIGAGGVLALTGVGAVALPLFILAAVLLGCVGYILGSYALGARILFGSTQEPPETLGQRAGAALLGAAIVALVALVPFLGWWAVLAVALFGLGGLLPSRALMGAERVGL